MKLTPIRFIKKIVTGSLSGMKVQVEANVLRLEDFYVGKVLKEPGYNATSEIIEFEILSQS